MCVGQGGGGVHAAIRGLKSFRACVAESSDAPVLSSDIAADKLFRYHCNYAMGKSKVQGPRRVCVCMRVLLMTVIVLL